MRCLRAIARDSKVTPKLRLRACELLMHVDPTILASDALKACKPHGTTSLTRLLGDMVKQQ